MTQTQRTVRFLIVPLVCGLVGSEWGMQAASAQWRARGAKTQVAQKPAIQKTTPAQVAQNLVAPEVPPSDDPIWDHSLREQNWSPLNDTAVPLDTPSWQPLPADEKPIVDEFTAPLPEPAATQGLVAPVLPTPVVPVPAPYETRRATPPTGSRRTEVDSAVRIAVSASLLQDLFRKTSSTCGDVDDCILGARVTGQQKTDTRTRLVLIPDPHKASFNVLLSGVTNSATFGRTEIAGVSSTTTSRFEMYKPFTFDGHQITTSTPGATVWPNQTNQAAVPLRGNVPILRRVIGSIAYREAERRKPAAERITAGKVTEDASGRFNGRVDAALAKLQRDWAEKVVPLASRHLPNLDYPLARTTATHAVFSLPSPWATARGDLLPGEWMNRGESLSFAIHESALMAAVERLSLGGFEIGPGDWDRAARQFAPGLVDGAPPVFEQQTGSLLLDENDPIRVSFRDGQIHVVMTAKINTPLGTLPAQRITMPWTFSADATSIYADPGDPVVEAATEETNPMMSIVRGVMVTQLKTELLPIKIPRQFSKTIGEGDEVKMLDVRFDDLRCRDGWLVLGWGVTVR